MGTFSPTYEAIALQCMFGDLHSSAFPDPLFVCLFTSDPEVNGFDDEVDGTDTYVRFEVANVSSEWTIVGSTVENANAVTFAEATAAWGTITHWGLADDAAAVLPANLITSAPLSAPQSPIAGDTPEFAAGTLVVGAD